MVATVGSIAVAFSADLRRYEGALRAGEKRTNDFERRANKATVGVGNAFAKMGGMAKAGLAGLAAGIAAGGITGIVGRIGQVAKGIAAIGDEAKRAGVSARAFQEWRFVAEQNRIGIDAMSDGLKELNLRADEFVQTGKGSAAEAFMRLGYGSDELAKKLKDPSALLLEIIDRLGKFDKAAQIRISDELFGGSAGERFVELLDQGEAGIRATIDRAHELGVVMDDELIRKAAELDRRFHEVATTVGTALKTAIVSAADSLAEFIDGFREFEKQRTASLDNRMTEIGAKRLEIENRILKLREEQEGLGYLDAGRQGVIDSAISRLESERAALHEDEKRILAILQDRTTSMARSGDRTWTPPPPPPGGFGSTQKRDRAAEQADREAEAVRRLIGELEHELAVIGASDLERDIANELRRAGAAATAEQQAKIVGLVTALHAEAEAQRQVADAAALYGDIAKGVMQDLRSALSDGKLEWEELGNIAVRALDKIIDKIENQLIDALLGAMNFGGGIFGGAGSGISKYAGGIASGAIVGLFHGGGDAATPRSYRSIGAIDPSTLPKFHGGAGIGHKEIMALVEKTESIFTANQTGRIGNALSSVGGLSERTFNLNIDVQGAKAEYSETKDGANLRLVPQMLGAVAEDIARGGIVGRQIQNVFGAKRRTV